MTQQRTRADLLAASPDNTTRQIHPVNLRDVIETCLGYRAVVNPSVDNDRVDTAGINQEFDVGQFWTRTDTGAIFFCTSGVPGAAEWKLLVYDTDARLSDARTPTAHASTHNAGGSDAMAIDAAAGTGSLRTLGTSGTSACAGNDSRLSDARTPTSHASTHNAGGSDAMAIDAAAGTGSLRTLGTSGTSACAGNDSRLSDARTPTAHASTHEEGGSDAIDLNLVFSGQVSGSDVSVSSNVTPVAITGTTWSIAANETWSFLIHVRVTGSTAGLKFQLLGPSSPSSVVWAVANDAYVTAFSTSNATALATGGATTAFQIYGRVVNGANAGTIQPAIISVTNGQTNKALIGTHVSAWRQQ